MHPTKLNPATTKPTATTNSDNWLNNCNKRNSAKSQEQLKTGNNDLVKTQQSNRITRTRSDYKRVGWWKCVVARYSSLPNNTQHQYRQNSKPQQTKTITIQHRTRLVDSILSRNSNKLDHLTRLTTRQIDTQHRFTKHRLDSNDLRNRSSWENRGVVVGLIGEGNRGVKWWFSWEEKKMGVTIRGGEVWLWVCNERERRRTVCGERKKRRGLWVSMETRWWSGDCWAVTGLSTRGGKIGKGEGGYVR